MTNISNFSFMATFFIIVSFFSMLGVIKSVADNHAYAQSISPVSIGMNLIWNFFFFAVNFQFSIQGEGEYMQYLGLPAFWYFIASFTFETRLFMFVWRAQLNQQQMFDEQFLRRRLTWFYIVFYMTCFVAVIYQGIILYNKWAIMLFNASLWVPQIVHTYIRRSRKGPSMQFALALLTMQMFMPLYLMTDSDNFLDHKTDTMSAMALMCYMGLQLFIIKV